MKKILLIAAVLSTQMISAQALKEGNLSNVTRLTRDAVKYDTPRWSPDGTKIAFTQMGYNNLYVMQADGSAKKQISDASGVGYMYEWSADSKEILVRDTRFEQCATGIVRNHAAWAISMDGAKVRMTEDAEYMQPAAWRYSKAGVKSVMSLDAKILPVKMTALPKSLALKLSAEKKTNVSFIADFDNLYVVNANGTKKIINEGPSFCPVISPDGTKVAFNQMDDVCVMNIDGTGKRILGRGFNPSWANNSQIVFEKTTDDGHVYTSGELYMINVDGTNHKQLTKTGNRIEMNASVSPDGTKVAFVSFSDGQVYVADLK